MFNYEVRQAIRDRAPVIHIATVNCDEIEYECILSMYPLKSGYGVVLKDKSGNSITCALPENIKLKE